MRTELSERLQDAPGGVYVLERERAYDERVGWMLLPGREAAFDVLRVTPRFQQMRRRIGPPEAVPDATRTLSA